MLWLSQGQHIVLACCVYCIGDAAIYATSPQNVTAVVQSSAMFRCKTDASMPIRWNRIVPDQLLPLVIYNGYSISRRLAFKYVVQAELGQLEVKDVGFLDAGTYSCNQLNSSVNRVLFQLSVAGESNLGLLHCNSLIIYNFIK